MAKNFFRNFLAQNLEELRVRNRIVTELDALNRESPDFLKQWEEKNDILRTMGILPVAMEEWERGTGNWERGTG